MSGGQNFSTPLLQCLAHCELGFKRVNLDILSIDKWKKRLLRQNCSW